MQPPENSKDVIEILGIDADSVVPNRKDPVVLFRLRGDVNDWGRG